MSLEHVENNLQDLQVILSKIGKVSGCVKVFNLDTMATEIKNEFSNELKTAKGIWMEFEIKSTASIFTINEIMTYITEDVDEDCEIIFEPICNENILENTVKCKMLFTGLI